MAGHGAHGCGRSGSAPCALCWATRRARQRAQAARTVGLRRLAGRCKRCSKMAKGEIAEVKAVELKLQPKKGSNVTNFETCLLRTCGVDGCLQMKPWRWSSRERRLISTSQIWYKRDQTSTPLIFYIHLRNNMTILSKKVDQLFFGRRSTQIRDSLA